MPSASASSHDRKSKESSDDKRRHIKSLIDKIPTDKKSLFEYKVEWDLVDNSLMEKRIRPWVSKKIEDVQMVLDDEAEVFVVKLWRLLIYEIENKKLKASLASSGN